MTRNHPDSPRRGEHTHEQPVPGARTSAFTETTVEPGESVAAECPYCARPFRDGRARDLHVGEVHGSECTSTEKAAFEDARDAERDELFYFHLRVVAALAVLYSAVVLVYMIALGSGFL